MPIYLPVYLSAAGERPPGSSPVHDAFGVFQVGAVEELVILASGTGGEDRGELAANLAVATVHEALVGSSEVPWPRRMTDALREAQAALNHESGFQEGEGLSASVMAAWVKGGEVRLGWGGTCRALHLHGREPGTAPEGQEGIGSRLSKTVHESRDDAREFRVVRGGLTLEEGDAVVLATAGLFAALDDAAVTRLLDGRSPEEACDALLAAARGAQAAGPLATAVLAAGRERIRIPESGPGPHTERQSKPQPAPGGGPGAGPPSSPEPPEPTPRAAPRTTARYGRMAALVIGLSLVVSLFAVFLLHLTAPPPPNPVAPLPAPLLTAPRPPGAPFGDRLPAGDTASPEAEPTDPGDRAGGDGP